MPLHNVETVGIQQFICLIENSIQLGSASDVEWTRIQVIILSIAKSRVGIFILNIIRKDNTSRIKTVYTDRR